ncbi:MAG: hypothetical protein CMM94_06980 [Rickettsiales bacterium]|nr:hypothetical protein [Rickettsiales bacterium]
MNVPGAQLNAQPLLNNILANRAPRVDAASTALKQVDADVRAQAQKSAAQAGGATSTAQYSYTVGPDGQLYATSATVTTTRRGEGVRDPLSLAPGQVGNDNTSPSSPLNNIPDRRPSSLSDLLRPRPQLSPSDEAAVFGSEAFLKETQESNDAAYLARLQLADFGVRAQENQHLQASGGLGSAPKYDYQVGPDGKLYAVAGSVSISSGPAATPEEAAADAAAVGRAALAATDVSAQDISVARKAQSNAAYLYASNNNIVDRANPAIDLAS